jgi:hypothetical protein
MQPLDITFFKTWRIYMALATATKLRVKSGQQQSTEHIVSLVSTAFPRTAMKGMVMNGFRNSGLWPVDRFVFMDDDFALSIFTNLPGQYN